MQDTKLIVCFYLILACEYEYTNPEKIDNKTHMQDNNFHQHGFLKILHPFESTFPGTKHNFC